MQQTQNESCIFMHCLPAFKSRSEFSQAGEEVSESVFESAQSRVFEQAENRLHTIQALMCWSIGN
jgi:ornithine carbamoyltransferase